MGSFKGTHGVSQVIFSAMLKVKCQIFLREMSSFCHSNGAAVSTDFGKFCQIVFDHTKHMPVGSILIDTKCMIIESNLMQLTPIQYLSSETANRLFCSLYYNPTLVRCYISLLISVSLLSSLYFCQNADNLFLEMSKVLVTINKQIS